MVINYCRASVVPPLSSLMAPHLLRALVLSKTCLLAAAPSHLLSFASTKAEAVWKLNKQVNTNTIFQIQATPKSVPNHNDKDPLRIIRNIHKMALHPSLHPLLYILSHGWTHTLSLLTQSLVSDVGVPCSARVLSKIHGKWKWKLSWHWCKFFFNLCIVIS